SRGGGGVGMKHNTGLASLTGADRGFTIVELLVTMVIALLVLTAIYQTFRSQQDSFIAQEQIAAAQQNLRAGMFLMESEIQMAGCNPTGKVPSTDIGFRNAASGTVRFTKDVTGGYVPPPGVSDGVDNDGDGVIDNLFEEHYGDGDVADTNEDITYTLNAVTGNLTRNGQPIAENIDALDFVFLDKDNNPLNSFGGSVPSGSLPDIRSVQITMVSRISREGRVYTNRIAYQNQRPGGSNTILPAQYDKVTRRILTVTIRCRNII
ncbi:PilW family protein, partial [Thermodesulfobacteriota bacterium]